MLFSYEVKRAVVRQTLAFSYWTLKEKGVGKRPPAYLSALSSTKLLIVLRFRVSALPLARTLRFTFNKSAAGKRFSHS